MTYELRPNHILWFEDEEMLVDSYYDTFSRNKKIREAFGNNIKLYKSKTIQELSNEDAEKEINHIIKKYGNKPAIINLQTAQLGRTYLSKIIPGAIISDSNFPLNGAVIVDWMQEHGPINYPLIGFSARDLDDLPEKTRRFFAQTHARYFCKLGSASEYIPNLIDSLVFSNKYVKEVLAPSFL